MTNGKFIEKQSKMNTSFLKLTVRKKLLGGFLIVLLLLGGIGLLSNIGIKTVDNNYTALLNEQVATVDKIRDLKLEVMTHSDAIRGFLITGDSDYLYEFDDSVKRFDNVVKDIEVSGASAKTKRMVKNLDSIQQDYQLNVQKQIELKQAHKTDDFLMMMKTSAKDIGVEFNKQANDLIKYQKDQLNKRSEETTALINKTRTIIVIISVAAFIIGIMFAYFISRTISNPISKASEAIRRVASGDLTIEEMKVRNRDEIGTMVGSLNQMIKDLRSVIVQVNDSSTQVASSSEGLAMSAEESKMAAEQVAQIAQRNSYGMEQQLLHFHEVTASVSEMTSGILQISNNSEQMLQATEKATSITGQGTEYVENVVQQMNHIHHSVGQVTSIIESLEKRSKEISNIVGMITRIADQTNLLALNAAIEAARAGEHGKGFAVVANEVRNLAEESKKSAEKITSMILEIQKETQQAVQAMTEGNRQVVEGLGDSEKVNSTFANILKSIEGVGVRVQKVANSVEELTLASGNISDTVAQVKEISEKSAAAGQESAAATEEQLATMEEVTTSAESLSRLAEKLQSVISRFKI
ncbi:methyl-accepting chemotaxis protein [Peribacillus cavernae]|uniref:Methyl-accepting chemotaxis protein n=1 Tax=Peribacillus cavernae TaxID=1674310 RepID=A0A433HPA3_9BACI|nr:methyl-accepting chemotaxis protein [Peribacillus cavernae]MDQ0217434.1 methyl-accepting chemotaxis protein [Peribacillus cavernae]RUQ30119.1 methyl-accepting chemotaxis protein [Peribacillus cavernae]